MDADPACEQRVRTGDIRAVEPVATNLAFASTSRGSSRARVRLLAYVVATATTGALAAGAPRFVEDGYRIDSVVFRSGTRIAEGDFDSDGKAELAFAAWSSGEKANVERRAVLVTLDHDTIEGYRIGQTLLLAASVDPARVMGWREAGGDRLILVGKEGTARIFGGDPLTELLQFPIVNAARAASAGDVDGDGHDELLVLGAGGLYTYALPDGRLLKNYATVDHTDVAIAQLDADPAMEIMLTGAFSGGGKVIDGATFATEWNHPAGFGNLLAVGDFLGNGRQQWVGAKYWYDYALFGSAPWAPIWSVTARHDTNAIGTARSPSAPRDLLLIGEGQWGALKVVDGVSGQDLLSVRNDGYSISATTGADIDGDGTDELVFTSYPSGGLTTVLTIAGVDGSDRWRFHTTEAPYYAAAHGDVDGDGNVELVTANKGYWHSTLTIFDATTHAPLWRSPEEVESNETWRTKAHAIVLRERPGISGMDIVVAGDFFFTARLYVIDGVTKQILMDTGASASGPLGDQSVVDIALVDHDGDGSKEIAVLVRDRWFGSGLSILLWDMQGNLIWRSMPFGDSSSVAHSLLVMPGTSSDDPQLLAVLADGVRAFDAGSGVEGWRLGAPNDGAAFVPSGSTGPELATYANDGRVWFYDATTRALLRQWQLPASLRSLQALDGHVHAMLAAVGNGLALIDGRTGQVRSQSLALSPFWPARQPVSATPVGERDWIVATPTQLALHHLRIEISDGIFVYGFE